ncbi:MAG: ABC transporter substrate-binding protein [Janthinobacterium lividum]
MTATNFQRTLAILKISTLAAVCAALPCAASAQSKDPVRVGIVTSQSGVEQQQGEEAQRAIQFAIDEANANGGVDGRKVLSQVGDDEGTPEAGRRVAEKLARGGYNLLIGSVASGINLAIAQNLDRWDAINFATLAKSDKLTGDSCKPRSFRTDQSDSMDLAMIQQWAKDFKETNFDVLAGDFVWGRDSGESFNKTAKALGKSVDLSLYAPLNTSDFSPYIAQLKASKAQAVWVALVGRDLIAFVKQAQQYGLLKSKRIIGHAMIMNYVVQATGDATAGIQGNLGYGPEIDTPRNKAFVAAWQKKFNRLPTDNEGEVYAGMEVMFDGVRKAHSVKPGDIAKALTGSTVETIYGSSKVRKDNQLEIPNYVGVVKTVNGVLRPVIERTFSPSIYPPASPLCKM